MKFVVSYPHRCLLCSEGLSPRWGGRATGIAAVQPRPLWGGQASATIVSGRLRHAVAIEIFKKRRRSCDVVFLAGRNCQKAGEGVGTAYGLWSDFFFKSHT